jgi:hypothetical protein
MKACEIRLTSCVWSVPYPEHILQQMIKSIV